MLITIQLGRIGKLRHLSAGTEPAMLSTALHGVVGYDGMEMSDPRGGPDVAVRTAVLSSQQLDIVTAWLSGGAPQIGDGRNLCTE